MKQVLEQEEQERAGEQEIRRSGDQEIRSSRTAEGSGENASRSRSVTWKSINLGQGLSSLGSRDCRESTRNFLLTKSVRSPVWGMFSFIVTDLHMTRRKMTMVMDKPAEAPHLDLEVGRVVDELVVGVAHPGLPYQPVVPLGQLDVLGPRLPELIS